MSRQDGTLEAVAPPVGVIRPSREVATRLVVQLLPEYMEVFREAQRPEGWRKVAEVFGQIRKRLKIDGYVALYDDERRLHACFAYFWLGAEGVREWAEELNGASPEELRKYVEDFSTELLDSDWGEDLFPESPQRKAELQALFEALPPEEKAEAIKRGQYLYSFVIAFFYQSISVMAHGEKLTSLVPKAMAGDRDAFLKAIHIDKSLLHAHPWFKDRHEEAQGERDEKLLREIGYRLQVAPTRGRIRHPGLYAMFSMLEALGWLNDLRHDEILDLCDEAQLDRWQNRIEDVNYLTKRLIGYKRMQKSGGVVNALV